MITLSDILIECAVSPVGEYFMAKIRSMPGWFALGDSREKALENLSEKIREKLSQL